MSFLLKNLVNLDLEVDNICFWFIYIDKGTTAKAIRRLEELNLIKRLKDSTDKRINRIYLTTKAINIKDEFFYILTKWENMLTKNLSSEELSMGLNILNKLSNNVINDN